MAAGSPHGLANTNHSPPLARAAGWGRLGLPIPPALRAVCAAADGACFPLLSHHFWFHLGFSYNSVLFPWAGNPSVQILPLVSCSLMHSFGERLSGFLSFPTSLLGLVFSFWLLVPHLTTNLTLRLAEIICSFPLITPRTCSV